MRDNHASGSRHQSRDDHVEHQRDSGIGNIRSGKVQEEEASDGGGGSDEEEDGGGDPEPGSVPKEEGKVRGWYCKIPNFRGGYTYEIGFDFI
jgi:hypothetical protein